MAIELPPLPFSAESLEPYISKNTISFHYGKHHKNYVDTLNKLILGTEYENESLEDIMLQSSGLKMKVYNNAAQAWNHDFQWNCLTSPGQRPSRELEQDLSRQFGSLENFKSEFTEQAKALFGSGWAWLVKDKSGHLKISTLSNAGNPMVMGETPLFTCDVWEHAYYLDYQNEREKYLKNMWQIVNWDFIAANLARPENRLKGERSSALWQSQKH